MVRTSKEEKARALVDTGGVFKIDSSDKYDYYVVRGSKGDVYKVVYNKIKDLYTCDCKNIRLIECYHILACKTLRNVPN
jgi:hypothetical protein